MCPGSELTAMWPWAVLSASVCTQRRMPAGSLAWVRAAVMNWSAPSPQGAKASVPGRMVNGHGHCEASVPAPGRLRHHPGQRRCGRVCPAAPTSRLGTSPLAWAQSLTLAIPAHSPRPPTWRRT